MVAVILTALGYDPAYIVPAGGPVPGLERFARWGSGPFVIEADEYDRLFLGLQPAVAIITSVDWDHVDIYPTRESVEQAFEQFITQTALTVVACGDDVGVRRVLGTEPIRSQALPAVALYGLEQNESWQADDIQVKDGITTFRVKNHAVEASVTGRIQVPGRHNVQNALGAAIGVLELIEDVTLDQIFEALQSFRGAARRFELKGEASGITVIDDYAHNPPKVRAAIQAANMRYPDRRLVVYFQPHTFSRTAALIEEFADVFAEADVVRIGDIYRSRERPEDFPGIDAAFLAQRIKATNVEVSGSVIESGEVVAALVKPGDVLLTLGAGDGNKVGEYVLRELKNREPRTEN
jgi:UDP-N-acetylmuramate--alanine ligase